MIHDTLANLLSYPDLPEIVKRALDYLCRTDFAQTADGQYELDGDRLVAIVKHCRPKPPQEAVWETHRRHIDVHYVIEGTVRMGHLKWREGLTIRKPYDAGNDSTTFDVRGELFEALTGSVVVFLPDDVHASDVAGDGTTPEVRKVVLKCLVDTQAN
jgi:YhcH/YjgK/YiaL family protein